MAISPKLTTQLGDSYTTTVTSDALSVREAKIASIQLEWEDETPGAGDDFLAGTLEINTHTYDTKANSGNGDYSVVYDSNGDGWGVALSTEGISEVTDMTCVGDVPAVAEVTDITCVGDAAVKEVTSVECVADVSASLDKEWFILYDDNGSVGFWYDVGNTGTQVDPDLVAATDRQVEITTVNANDSAIDVATATYNAVVADSKFEAGADGLDGTFTVQSSTFGAKTSGTAGTSGFTVSVDTAGVDSSLDGTYFLLQDTDGSVGVWIDVDDSGTTIPAGASAADRALEITTVTSGMTASQVGGVVSTAINADSKFSTSAASEVVTVTNADAESLPDAADGDTGFGFSTTTQGVTADLLDGTYFLLQDVDGSVAFWVDTDDSGTTIPAGASAADRAVEITTVTSGMSASQVAGVVSTAINADSKFGTSVASEVVTITNVDKKALTDAADGDSGFTFNVTTQGADLSAEPTGAIWASLDAAKKTQVDISADTTAADVAASAEVAWDGLTDFPFTTDDSAADGTMTFTNTEARQPLTAPVVKNSDDSGAGSIGVSVTTEGVVSEVNVASDSVTLTAHGQVTGAKGQLTSTGTLPGGLATSTDYFLIKVDANTVKFATSLANAQAGTAVTITDEGTSGATHTFTATALASASYKFQSSNDGTTWYDIGTATSITATGGVMQEFSDIGYRYLRSYITLTAGQLKVTELSLIKNEV